MEELERLTAEGRPFIACFWHGNYIALFPLLEGRGAIAFVSDSPRGDVISIICEGIGFSLVRLHAHGGETSIELMKRSLADGASAVIAVDGPVGPRHEVKEGAIRLASELGHAIIPVSAAARRVLELKLRWDHLVIPLPFTRIDLVAGPALRVPELHSEEEVHLWSELLGEALEEAEARAVAAVGRVARIKNAEDASRTGQR